MNIEYFFEKPLSINYISETFKASFNRDFDEKYWKWRFLENPFSGKVYINYIIEDNILAAYYAVSPCQIIINSKVYKIALSNMTMTHPKFQGKGYFSKLAENMKSILLEDDFIGIYGFANHNSHYGFRKKMNWLDLSILNVMQIEKTNINKRIKNNPKISIIETEVDDDILLHCSKMNYSNANNKFIRNFDILKWRFLINPKNKYKVVICKTDNKIDTVCLIKYYNDEIDILEIFYNDNLLIDQYYYAFTNYLLKNYECINIWSNLFLDEHLILEKIGYQEKTFNTYFGIIPLKSENLDELFYLKNWHYRFMDSDIY